MTRKLLLTTVIQITSIFFLVEAFLTFEYFVLDMSTEFLYPSLFEHNQSMLLWRFSVPFCANMAVFLVLVKKAGRIADKFLPQGQGEKEVSISITQSEGLKLALVVLGAIAILFSFPDVIISIFDWAKIKRMGDLMADKSFDVNPLIGALVKIVVGFFLIQNADWFTGLLVRKPEDNTTR